MQTKEVYAVCACGIYLRVNHNKCVTQKLAKLWLKYEQTVLISPTWGISCSAVFFCFLALVDAAARPAVAGGGRSRRSRRSRRRRNADHHHSDKADYSSWRLRSL